MALIETVNYRSESEVLLALSGAQADEGVFVGGEQNHFVPESMQDNWNPNHRSEATVRGKTECAGEFHQTSITIAFPGLVKRAIDRINGREPRATVHLTIY